MSSKRKILRKFSLLQWILTIFILCTSVWWDSVYECLVGAGRDSCARNSSRRVEYDCALDFVVT